MPRLVKFAGLSLRPCYGCMVLIMICGMAAGGDPQPDGLAQAVKALGGTLQPQDDGTFIVNLSKAETSGKQLKQLATHADQITGLWLGDAPIVDADCRTLAQFPLLKHLDLRSTKITAGGISHLRGLKRLEGLSVAQCNGIDDAACIEIAKLPKLQHLGLTGTRITDKSLEALAACPGLKSLWLDNTAITDSGLKALAALVHLQTLVLNQTEITSEGMRHLRTLSQVEYLQLAGAHVDDAGLATLAQMPRLQSLILPAGIGDAGVNHLRTLTQLRQITLHDHKLTDLGFVTFQHMPQLQSLDLSNAGPESTAHITAVGIKSLAKCKELRSLSLVGTGIDDDCVAQLCRLDLPKLSTLFLGKSSLSDACIPQLIKLKGLRELDLVETGISRKAIERLEATLPHCKVNYADLFSF